MVSGQQSDAGGDWDREAATMVLFISELKLVSVKKQKLQGLRETFLG